IVTGVMKSRLKSVAPQRDATSYVRQGSMKLTNQRDLYLYREIHRTERPKETDSGSSGGSSTHTSSSGSTHGGGGGSF
ncbi:MAG: TPM domain-containing protein, partial [Faecalibacterium prausnitzii]|nr:TPM domain-containing protein [Faecalibacterium prausnitzii]